MNDFQSILLFPVRDEFARKQFIIAALVMLTGMIIPLIPMIILMGYGARIMRQVIDEDKEPTMLEWQGNDWGQLLQEGARLFAIRLIFILPVFLFMGCGFAFFMSSPILFASSDSGDPSPFGFITMAIGMGIFLLTMLLSLPLGVIIGAAESHVVTKQSFQAGLQFREWWPIFRAGLGQFVGAYLLALAISFILSFVMQIAMITIILICLMPFFLFGFSAYISLVLNALFARAYAVGRKAVQTVEHAPA
ncbi:MAG: DUF4013 domain-containing protein [Chloroflexota bacterium]